MSRTGLGVALTLVTSATVALSTACGAAPGNEPSTPDGEALATEVLVLDAGAAEPPGFAAMDAMPINRSAFAGWYAARRGAPNREPDRGELGPGTPGRTYLAITGQTGCRKAETVRLWRSGDELTVHFVGGVATQTCYRAYQPYAQVAVSTEAVRGVRTVNGKPPLHPNGPARLVAFVPLGTITVQQAETQPVELGGQSTWYQALVAANAENLDLARAALAHRPDHGHRGFAFLLAGCAETTSVLVVTPGYLAAELVGGRDTACAVPRYFLATFDLPAEFVPAQATLGRR
jgi:hypothetical protein